MSKELFLVDGSGFIFRAYHALPPLTRPDGTPVGAVMGFCNMLSKLLSTHRDAHIAVIFDAARKNFRNDIYAEYKAHRPPAPEDLIPQFPLIREASIAFGLPTMEMEGFEADDIIATYAKLAESENIKVTIVSSDKDLMQLVRGDIKLMDPMKQVMIGAAEVFEKFGVTPDKVVDVQALCGDPSDNVPGVPGIGVKTAAELINAYGSLENLLNNIAYIRQPKRRETLESNAELARISKKLVTLRDDVPVPIPVQQLVAGPQDQLAAFLEYQGFRTLLSRLTKTPVAPPADPASPSIPATLLASGQAEVTVDYQLITDAATLTTWLADAYETGVLAIDTETTGLTPARADLVGVSLATRPGRACYIPIGHGTGGDLFATPSAANTLQQPKIADIVAVLQKICADRAIIKVGHNMKFDLQMLQLVGLEFAALDDTMLMSYVLDGSAHGHGLDELSELHCAHKMISYDEVTGTGKNRISFAAVPLDKACDYAAEDADFTLRLYHILKPRLAAERMSVVYEDIERPLIQVIADMEQNGICVDKTVLKRLSQTFAEKIAALEADIHTEAGHPFNVGSPRQLGIVLFDEMGLQGGTKTKTGDWSTAADILENLAEQGYGFVDKILEWRHLSKLRSNYTESLQEAINSKTGRVHTSFAMALTNTGRLSSSDPNLQNIPIRTEEGRMIRTAFVAPAGHVLISADYSQIELRLAAELAQVKALQDSFRTGEDIHTRTASEVLGIPQADVTPEIRRSAKAINFGIIYGISGFGLAKQLGVSNGEASTYIRNYLGKFPELERFMSGLKDEARKSGYVKTFFGRKCVISGINDRNGAKRQFAERQAINAPLQGTAADIVKLAMTEVDRRIRSGDIAATLLLQVHDELVFEVREEDAAKVSAQIRQIMENVASFSIPLAVEAKWAKNWSDAH
ncbi:MAG TPA: DNA polymerase I [Rhodospirillaceae bacterium]|nr:DNA polymerase I [Rhodospirillaceae bacterium]